MTVAAAAPVTPQSQTATNSRSSTRFSTADTHRKYSVARESPTARRMEAMQLYRNWNTSPREYTAKYVTDRVISSSPRMFIRPVTNQRAPARPMSMAARPIPPRSINAVATALFSSSRRLAP